MGDRVEKLGVQVAFEGHTLHEAVAVAHQEEGQLALVRAVVDPSLDGDFLIDVIGYLSCLDNRRHSHSSKIWFLRCRIARVL